MMTDEWREALWGKLLITSKRVLTAFRRGDHVSDEFAWLIERRDRGAIEYLTGDTTGFFPDWAADSLVAIRFARRVDAERVAGIFDDLDIHICEHQWRAPYAAMKNGIRGLTC